MNTLTRDAGAAGRLSLAFALLAVLSLGWIVLLSAETSFAPPEWVRIALSQGLPIGLLGSALAGVVGLAISGLIVVTFIVVYSIMG